MPKRRLADEVYAVLMSRAPGEITCVRREKTEGRSRRARIKAMHVGEGRIRFRVTEPGEADDIHVSSTNAAETVQGVYKKIAEGRSIVFETLGSP